MQTVVVCAGWSVFQQRLTKDPRTDSNGFFMHI